MSKWDYAIPFFEVGMAVVLMAAWIVISLVAAMYEEWVE